MSYLLNVIGWNQSATAKIQTPVLHWRWGLMLSVCRVVSPSHAKVMAGSFAAVGLNFGLFWCTSNAFGVLLNLLIRKLFGRCVARYSKIRLMVGQCRAWSRGLGMLNYNVLGSNFNPLHSKIIWCPAALRVSNPSRLNSTSCHSSAFPHLIIASQEESV